MSGPIETGMYRASGGATVEIFETGCFAYGRVVGTTEDDFWRIEDGHYTVPEIGSLDLVERIGDRPAAARHGRYRRP